MGNVCKATTIMIPHEISREPPAGCHECKEWQKSTQGNAWCIEAAVPGLNEIAQDVTNHVKNETFHPDCPYKEKWEMYNKLKQL